MCTVTQLGRLYQCPGFARDLAKNPGFARDMAKPTETLKNMNTSTSKHASWVVRVLAQKVIRYQFVAKGKQVQAQKFECILVAANPVQFMIGTVLLWTRMVRGRLQISSKKEPAGASSNLISTPG